MEVPCGVMPRFRLDFRRVLVEADATFVDGLLMRRWSAVGPVLAEDAAVDGISGVTVPGTASPDTLFTHAPGNEVRFQH